MVGKVSVIPYGVPVPGVTDVFGSAYSHYKICIDEFVWLIAISPAVKAVTAVKRLKGVGNLSVSLMYNIDGRVFYDEENLDLGFDARKELCSQEVFNMLKRVDRWELGD